MTVKHPIPQGNAKRVAVIVTEYRYNSHADVILGRLLGDFDYRPRVEVASIYTDQVPANDMSREEAARCGVPICATIAEAINAPYAQGGLDGVIIIGEHGDYPDDERGCKQYPRRRLLDETLQALDELGIRVPVFSDKHLSYTIENTVWMFEQIRERGIPFMGGSSIPHTPHVPAFDPALLEDAAELLVVSFSSAVEAYSYHALEVLQSLAEKRAGGETGIVRIKALQGQEVWDALSRKEWPEGLLTSAYALFSNGAGGDYPKAADNWTVLFIVEYKDGTKGYIIQQNEWIDSWGFAFRRRSGDITAAECSGDKDRPFRHFETLTRMIEDFIITGAEPFPTERVYMSSGMTNYAMDALHTGKTVETPELANVKY